MSTICNFKRIVVVVRTLDPKAVNTFTIAKQLQYCSHSEVISLNDAQEGKECSKNTSYTIGHSIAMRISLCSETAGEPNE